MTAVGVAAVLVAGGAVAVAGAAQGGKGKAAHAKRHIVKRLVRSGVHADVSLIRADGSVDAFSVDRGRVTASTSTSLTLKRADGKSVTVSLSSATLARGTVTVGKPVLVFSRNGAAFRIRAPGAALAAPLASAIPGQKSPIVHLDVKFVRADGSTVSVSLDRGRVTASSSSSLTIERPDGKSVTFALGGSVVVRGRLGVGGKALVIARNGAVVRVLAHGAPATG
jgi:hypothetical protein